MEKSDSPVSIQNTFFNQARKDRAKVIVYLATGTKLVGRIKSFDKFTVILESSSGEQMIFKHAISTVSAQRSFSNHIPVRKARTEEARSQGSASQVAQGTASASTASDSSSDGG